MGERVVDRQTKVAHRSQCEVLTSPMPQAKILPSFELYSEQQKAVIARIGPLFRDAADRHARGQLRRQAGEEVAALRPADSAYSIPTWAESACNYIQNHFKPPPSNIPTAKMVTHRQRARKWTDMWAEEHMDELHARIQAMGMGDGLKARNLAIKELTEDVADDEKARYRQAARQHKEADGLTTAQQLKNRKDLLKYARSVAATLNTNYGIPFSILLTGYKDDEGDWSVTALDNNDIINPSISAMSKSKPKEFNTVLTLWQTYVQDMADTMEADDEGTTATGTTVLKVADPTGRDAPILQLDSAGHCVIPSDVDLNAFDAKSLSRALREVWTAEYVLATGVPSATVPWVDIRAQPHKYFDVDAMWLEDVPVEDPSHIRRRSVLSLLQQYRARDHRFLRFTGVQRNGEFDNTDLYHPHPVHEDSEAEQPLSATIVTARSSAENSRKSRPTKSALRRKAKGKRRALTESSEEAQETSTDDEEQNVTDLLGGDHTHAEGRSMTRSDRPRARPVTRSAMKNPSAAIIDGLLTLSDYADQAPDEFREQRDRHVNYVKALAPEDIRLQATADHVFGLRSSTVEVARYGRIPMLPWADWYYDSVRLPGPRNFNYGAMWEWLRSRQFITNDLFFNKAGQLEQMTLACAMLLRELNDTAFDRASPSEDVVERESILSGELNINSATDIIHSVLELLHSITPPPSNAPIATAPSATGPGLLVGNTIPSAATHTTTAASPSASSQSAMAMPTLNTSAPNAAVVGPSSVTTTGVLDGTAITSAATIGNPATDAGDSDNDIILSTGIGSDGQTASSIITSLDRSDTVHLPAGNSQPAGNTPNEAEHVDLANSNAAGEAEQEPEDPENPTGDDSGPADAAMRKRKRAPTGPSASGETGDVLQNASAKPPSKVAKGHEFTEKITRSGRHTTVSERARGNVVLK
ncbi:hypothetical protein BDW22DRAFT_1346785 [Trametopsis cervina]|nr:hypothetical protein BDW22DRAFT_1346785 [Trametopsis cervina]